MSFPSLLDSVTRSRAGDDEILKLRRVPQKDRTRWQNQRLYTLLSNRAKQRGSWAPSTGLGPPLFQQLTADDLFKNAGDPNWSPGRAWLNEQQRKRQEMGMPGTQTQRALKDPKSVESRMREWDSKNREDANPYSIRRFIVKQRMLGKTGWGRPVYLPSPEADRSKDPDFMRNWSLWLTSQRARQKRPTALEQHEAKKVIAQRLAASDDFYLSQLRDAGIDVDEFRAAIRDQRSHVRQKGAPNGMLPISDVVQQLSELGKSNGYRPFKPRGSQTFNAALDPQFGPDLADPNYDYLAPGGGEAYKYAQTGHRWGHVSKALEHEEAALRWIHNQSQAANRLAGQLGIGGLLQQFEPTRGIGEFISGGGEAIAGMVNPITALESAGQFIVDPGKSLKGAWHGLNRLWAEDATPRERGAALVGWGSLLAPIAVKGRVPVSRAVGFIEAKTGLPRSQIAAAIREFKPVKGVIDLSKVVQEGKWSWLTPKQMKAYVESSPYSVVFGEIGPEVSNATGGLIPPGKIRLPVGDPKYGFTHAGAKHGGEMTAEGYADVKSYFEDVLSNYKSVKLVKRPGKPARLLLVKPVGNGHVAVVELKIGPGGNHYSVVTGFPVDRPNYVKNNGHTIWVRPPGKS